MRLLSEWLGDARGHPIGPRSSRIGAKPRWLAVSKTAQPLKGLHHPAALDCCLRQHRETTLQAARHWPLQWWNRSDHPDLTQRFVESWRFNQARSAPLAQSVIHADEVMTTGKGPRNVPRISCHAPFESFCGPIEVIKGKMFHLPAELNRCRLGPAAQRGFSTAWQGTHTQKGGTPRSKSLFNSAEQRQGEEGHP